METKESLHFGHRKRMTEKIMQGEIGSADHELLEVLLYNVLPRIDTNPLAHKILHTFGSLAKVFSATPKELMTVDGVGKKTATYLATLGKIFRKINNKPMSKRAMFSFANNKSEIIHIFDGLYDEKFVLFLLDSHYQKITEISFESNSRKSVEGNTSEIANAFAINKPSYAIMAHNHPSGNLLPSVSDDETTAKINILCNIHGVTLIDHIIVGKSDAISYFIEGRLKNIKDACNIDSVIHKVKEINNE